MGKYLLIDSNNLGIRNSFTCKDMKNSSGISSGSHYGVIQSLIGLKYRFPGYQLLMAWDSKSARRVEESKLGVEKGIIPSIYKANRVKDDMPQPLKDFYEQQPFLKRGIGTTGIPQIMVSNFEADDVIASYANLLKKDHKVIMVTSDEDYFSSLDENVSVWDGMKKVFITVDDFKGKFGILPYQWTHIGALMGDIGDNIFGACGIGDKTALSEIVKHGTYKNVIENHDKENAKYRIQFPDLCSVDSPENRDKFKQLSELKTKKGHQKYKNIYFNAPYTGVAYAVEFGDFSKIKSTSLAILLYQEVIDLAYSLKKVDSDMQDLPEIIEQGKDRALFEEYLTFYDIYSLGDQVSVLF